MSFLKKENTSFSNINDVDRDSFDEEEIVEDNGLTNTSKYPKSSHFVHKIIKNTNSVHIIFYILISSTT